jgi:hypothetical protein
MLAQGQIFLHLEVAKNLFQHIVLPAEVEDPLVD